MRQGKRMKKNNNIITGRSLMIWNSCSPVPEPEQQKSDPSLYGLFFNNREEITSIMI